MNPPLNDDLYAVLGAPRDADGAALKAAYRERAWACHPDRGGGDQDHRAFQRLNEAYSILSVETKRAAYDRRLAAGRPAPAPPTPPGPIRCSECGKATAQPRLLVFQSVKSFIVWSWTSRTEGIFCAPCARRGALKASLISTLAGWWALPMGPGFTVIAILANARGGLTHEPTNQRLLLQNSKAFLARDRALLAYALAQKLDAAGDAGIAGEARQVISQLRAKGVPEPSTPLRDVWAARPVDWAAHTVMALWAPIAAAAAAAVWLAA